MICKILQNVGYFDDWKENFKVAFFFKYILSRLICISTEVTESLPEEDMRY